MKKPNLLIVDDNKTFIDSVTFVLQEFLVIKAKSPAEAHEKMSSSIDLILLDLVFNEKTPDKHEGLDFIPYLKENYPDIPIVILTNYPSIETTVKAIKAGATDFLNKRDLDWTEWKIRLLSYARNTLQIRELKKRNQELEQRQPDSEIIGISPAIDFVRKRLKDLAKNSTNVSIFLTGETGTGKNLAVKYFRRNSIKSEAPFKEFSILELSESLIESELFGHVKGSFTGANNDKKGLFELADGGILFLDEIGDYDIRIQTKILRFLDEKTITPVGSGKTKKLDLQLILASNQDIPALIKEKKFREDLYQRINRVRIELPALRERKEDIPLLVLHFFNHFREAEKTKLISVDPDVMNIFESYKWPGNIRELQSAIWDGCTRARLMNDTILMTRHLKSELIKTDCSELAKINNKGQNSMKKEVAEMELASIEEALIKCLGRKANAASLIGLNADQLRYKVIKLKNQFPELFAGHNYIKAIYKL